MTDRIAPTEFTEQQYGAWRQHPMTRFILQYLGDYAAKLEDGVVAEWKAGRTDIAVEHEARGRVLTLEEICTVEWPSIMKFYGIEPEIKEEEEDRNERTNDGRAEPAD